MKYSINKDRTEITVTPNTDKKHGVSASFSDELLCCAPFTVEDFHSTAGTLYQHTLRHGESGEVIAPLTSQQGMDMKLLLQCWDIAQAT